MIEDTWVLSLFTIILPGFCKWYLYLGILWLTYGFVVASGSLLLLLLAAKSLQSCPTLCDPIDCSPPGSPILGILQARTLEWVAISFSSAWKWKVKVKSLSCVRLLATPWTAANQAPPSMGFSRQEYWSGVPLPSLITSQKFLVYSMYQNHSAAWDHHCCQLT